MVSPVLTDAAVGQTVICVIALVYRHDRIVTGLLFTSRCSM